MGDSRTVECCINCDSTQITYKPGGVQEPERKEQTKYRCRNCGEHFDEPDTRPPKGPTGYPRSSHAASLEDADADDIMTDGGLTDADVAQMRANFAIDTVSILTSATFAVWLMGKFPEPFDLGWFVLYAVAYWFAVDDYLSRWDIGAVVTASLWGESA